MEGLFLCIYTVGKIVILQKFKVVGVNSNT